MARSRRSPRTAIVTRAPALARFMTAWPDELPAPTTTTSSPPHWARLAAARSVVNATFEQFVKAGKRQPSPDHPRGGKHDVCCDRVAPASVSRCLPDGGDRVADDAALQDELCAEALRLTAGEPGKLGASDAVDEPEEVLDQGRVRRLATGHVCLDQHGRQPIGCGVHGRAEPAGPAPTIASS